MVNRNRHAVVNALHNGDRASSHSRHIDHSRPSILKSGATRVLSRLVLAHSCIHSALFSTAANIVNHGASAATIVEPPKPIEYFRMDYKKSEYSIDEIYLSFQLDDSSTLVTSTSTVTKEHDSSSADLELDGEELELHSVKIDGTLLDPSQYTVSSEKLTIPYTTLTTLLGATLRRFQVETTVSIKPDKNLSLSGLYKSGLSSLLCTQCEATGFRRITYHLDRPDVLSRYRVRLEADRLRHPLLLSNGNLIEQGEVVSSNGNRHYAVWDDPFPKPSYLFALVAGTHG